MCCYPNRTAYDHPTPGIGRFIPDRANHLAKRLRRHPATSARDREQLPEHNTRLASERRPGPGNCFPGRSALADQLRRSIADQCLCVSQQTRADHRPLRPLRRQPAQLGRHPGSQGRAEAGLVCVCPILPPRPGRPIADRDELQARHLKAGTDHTYARTGVLKCESRRHPREPPHPGAPQQPHQHRLQHVVGVVGGRDPLGAARLSEVEQRGVPRVTRVRLVIAIELRHGNGPLDK